MKISAKGIEIIKHFEGLKLNQYFCGAGKATIGYGTTRYEDGSNVQIGDKCTKEQAEEFLYNDLAIIESKLNRHFKTIDQNQFDALCSWVYNLGMGNLLCSTLKSKILNNPNDPTIKNEFEKWCHIGKVKSTGLAKRRAAEWILYSTGNLIFN